MNPFIEFVKDPVAVLDWVAYALLLAAIFFGALRTVLREFPRLYVQYRNNRHTDAWWSFGERKMGYIPPLGWSVRFAGSLLVLATAAWAASALLWYVGV